MEKDDEINGSPGTSYTAQFWQYDSRLGRRWNVDPIYKEYESPYACLGNNPIILIDPWGADTILPSVVGEEGIYLPTDVADIETYDKDVVIGKKSGRSYNVNNGGLRKFSIDGTEYTVKWGIESGKFKGYQDSEGNVYQQTDHIPDEIKKEVFNLIDNNLGADVLSFSAGITATGIASGGGIEWAVNFMPNEKNGDRVFITKTRYEGNITEGSFIGLELDIGVDVNVLWYVGDQFDWNLTKEDMSGTVYKDCATFYASACYIRCVNENGATTFRGFSIGVGPVDYGIGAERKGETEVK